MLIKLVTTGWKSYSSITGVRFALLKIEQPATYHVLHKKLRYSNRTVTVNSKTDSTTMYT